ncbi:hypothetical protein SELR_pSRC500460 (plasmid) [Selenomonas ruminantium subsp. lactilytica TAM6421]|uniref:Uncharacterized protein n=1 Tax=Selenomonas ruminantium subsp. lactilytica (strain NBRC 103574 / TAM6421) TaxID=927704 RepID=I0GWT3_SELRL|nr:hypothetical protein [Selenomonas ruminantium]BAL85220.1 hypothetical protein SELR_pSRC500460 [Selenomonas ruminantium subsp. lactilytica TAM6421]
MKKVFVVVTLLFSLFLPLSHCSAADWYWILSDDKKTVYVDRSSGIWDGMDLHVGLKVVKANGEYSLINLIARYESGNEIYLQNSTVFVYDKNGRYILHFSDDNWIEVKPNTAGQVLAFKLFELYQGHFKRDNKIPE